MYTNLTNKWKTILNDAFWEMRSKEIWFDFHFIQCLNIYFMDRFLAWGNFQKLNIKCSAHRFLRCKPFVPLRFCSTRFFSVDSVKSSFQRTNASLMNAFIPVEGNGVWICKTKSFQLDNVNFPTMWQLWWISIFSLFKILGAD